MQRSHLVFIFQSCAAAITIVCLEIQVVAQPHHKVFCWSFYAYNTTKNIFSQVVIFLFYNLLIRRICSGKRSFCGSEKRKLRSYNNAKIFRRLYFGQQWHFNKIRCLSVLIRWGKKTAGWFKTFLGKLHFGLNTGNTSGKCFQYSARSAVFPKRF